MPHTSQLFGFEKEAGNVLRLIPHLGCQEIMEQVFVKVEQGTLINTLGSLNSDLEDKVTAQITAKKKKQASEVAEERKVKSPKKKKKEPAASGEARKNNTSETRKRARLAAVSEHTLKEVDKGVALYKEKMRKDALKEKADKDAKAKRKSATDESYRKTAEAKSRKLSADKKKAISDSTSATAATSCPRLHYQAYSWPQPTDRRLVSRPTIPPPAYRPMASNPAYNTAYPSGNLRWL